MTPPTQVKGGYIEGHCRIVGGEAVCDFRGHRYRAPWRCLCCGAEISFDQWCFGRSCPRCDTGKCQTGQHYENGELTIEHELGHGRSDIVAGAEISDPDIDCASDECVAHAEANAARWPRRRWPKKAKK